MRAMCVFLAVAPIAVAAEKNAAPTTRPAAGRGSVNAFFAMDTATKDANHETYEAQARLVKELGYDGWAPAAKGDVREMLEAVDRHGVKLFAVYAFGNVDPDQPKYDPTLKATIAALKGRDTIVWLAMPGRKLAPASSEGDERAVGIIREVADLAAGSRLRVSLYPHHAFYLESVDDALRLMRKADRPNVSITFNLCHWLRVDRKRDLEGLLKRAMPHLTVVTINGADVDGEDWGRLIQPLGRGSFDVYAFLRTLTDFGYTGPIGFQGYGIKGDVRQRLGDTMQAWQTYARRLTEENRKPKK